MRTEADQNYLKAIMNGKSVMGVDDFRKIYTCSNEQLKNHDPPQDLKVISNFNFTKLILLSMMLIFLPL